MYKAALLAKTDLTTELVKEFTELQGIVGGLYAQVQQLDPILPAATADAIGDAIYDQYKPESMDDGVPRSVEGAVLAIADKADSIAGMFALGLQPTGSKDPFALRRSANGIVKIIAEHKLPLPIAKLFSDARAEYVGSEAEKRFAKEVNFEDAIAEIHARAPGVLSARCARIRLRHGQCRFKPQAAITSSTLSRGLKPSRRYGDCPISKPSPLPSSASTTFCEQAKERGIARSGSFELLPNTPPEEENLKARIEDGYPEIQEGICREGLHRRAGSALDACAGDIDLFFDKVMVMVDDERVRANSLALLRDLLHEFSIIADFSEIVTENTKASPAINERA